MKKGFVIVGLLWLSTIMLFATQRTPEEAMAMAKQFAKEYNAQSGGRRMVSARAEIAASSAAYYAVNMGSSYVLVASDDRMPDILGYSDNGSFDAEQISPALRYWLNCYDEELAEIDQQTMFLNAPRRATQATSPLMTCRWNQSAPYNDLAPAYDDNGSKCVTGCVATAMAQIMYYHRYPQQGTGSHSYFWICTEPVGKTGTLSANFGNTTYEWDNMLDNYRSGYTNEQANAVATLMYHCGVSINMGYGQSSGAYTSDVPVSLKNYFGYDANYQRIQKVMYPADSLNAIIASELASGRPVLVSGSNAEGGHAFVCDGCDNRGYFHINWGWGGSNDGYYLLTALNPGKSQGIGGTTQGYNKGTAFYIGLRPSQTGTPKAIPQMAAENISVSAMSFTRSGGFTVSISRLENFGLTDFSGSYGVALYDEEETELVQVLKKVDNYSLSAGYHRTTTADVSSITIPNSIPAGTYHLCAVYKNSDYGWMRMLCTQDDYYKTLTIEGNQVTIYPNDAEAVLQLESPISFGEGVNADSIPFTGVPLSFSVKNTGGTFRGDISARIYKGNFSKGQYEIADSLVLRRNQTLNSALQQAFDKNLLVETQYKMKLCWRADANDSWHDFTPASYAELPFKLYDAEYHLSLTDTIRFDNNDSVPRNNANLYYSIKNTGAPFAGELQVFFYKNGFSKGQSSLRTISVGSNETISGSFSGPLSQPADTYNVVLRYRETDGEWQDFLDIYGRNIGSIEATLVDESATSLIDIDGATVIERRLLMRMGVGDLYLFTIKNGEQTSYKKVFIINE